jgi:hypothetical protein
MLLTLLNPGEYKVAVLPDLDRARIWAWFMRRNTDGSAYTKADLRAAVDATDAWIESNAAAFNTALPQPFRGAATAQQKTDLLCWVAQRRAGKLRVEEDG